MHSYPSIRAVRNSSNSIRGIATDSGRTTAGLYNEKNDCTVRAYATAAGIDYRQAHAELFVAGRKMRHGFHVQPFFNAKFGKPLPRPQILGAWRVK